MTYFYPAVCTHEGDQFTLRFPDLPGCGARAADMDEAARKARESLAAELLEMEGKGQTFPPASDEKVLKCRFRSACVCTFRVDLNDYRAYKEYKVNTADSQSAAWAASARKGRPGLLARVFGLR